MANFLILRQEKLKSAGAVKGLAKHNFRAIPTANADPSRLILNDHRTSSDVVETMEKYNSLLPEKVRKNAIHAINYMITTSPEASEHNNELALEEGINWVTQMYGAENVIMSTIHRDEATPHLHIMVMPLKNQKLNAKHYVGGSKHRLSEMQTEFYEHVKGAGGTLERGTEGSKAQHQSTSKWAAKQKELGKDVKLPSKDVLQSQVKLTTVDRLRPESAQKRISKVLEGVLGQREDALVSVEAYKIEFDRNKNELSGLRAEARKAERSITTLTQVKEDWIRATNDPERRQLEIEKLTKLEKAYKNGRSKLEQIRERISAFLSQSIWRHRETRIDERVRPTREIGREWCTQDNLRTTGSTTPIQRESDRHNGLQRT